MPASFPIMSIYSISQITLIKKYQNQLNFNDIHWHIFYGPRMIISLWYWLMIDFGFCSRNLRCRHWPVDKNNTIFKVANLKKINRMRICMILYPVASGVNFITNDIQHSSMTNIFCWSTHCFTSFTNLIPIISMFSRPLTFSNY